MINETLKRIETTVSDCETLAATKRYELLTLISELKQEIGKLEGSDSDAAGSIARYAESSVSEAVRAQPDTELLNHSLRGLSLSVQRFEASHPTLMGIINNIGQALNSAGI